MNTHSRLQVSIGTFWDRKKWMLDLSGKKSHRQEDDIDSLFLARELACYAAHHGRM